jgi:hypothetical protein
LVVLVQGYRHHATCYICEPATGFECCRTVAECFASHRRCPNICDVHFDFSDQEHRFVNSGTSPSRIEDAQIYTTSTATADSAGATKVYFSFLQTGLSTFINNVVADYTLTAAVAKGDTASVAVGYVIQPIVTGTMTFKSTTPITLESPYFAPTTFAAGANLLTVTFNTGMIGSRNGSTSTLSGSTEGGSVVEFTSDFLDFDDVTNADLSATFSAMSTLLQVNSTGNRSVSSFRATAGGQFSSDPAPMVVGIVPEPVSWVMMVAGFAMLGIAVRRQSRNVPLTL